MVRVRKSPNMMSITGRIPVIAAPTPSPVNPASDIGVSITRSVPNSSTSPESTLNGVPASATSSPKMHTRESRRISSARASRIAWAKVSSRSAGSGINVLIHLGFLRIRRGNRKFHRRLHLGFDFPFDLLQRGNIGNFFADQPLAKQQNRIAARFPLLLFLLGAVILAVNVANVMPGVAVGVTKKERRPLAATRALNQSRRRRVHCSDVLPIHAF